MGTRLISAILLLIFAPMESAWADELLVVAALPPAPSAEPCDNPVPGRPEAPPELYTAAIAAAEDYLLTIPKGVTNFSQEEVEKQIRILEGIVTDPGASAPIKSQAMLIQSGLNAKIFEKIAPSGTDYARNSYQLLKRSLQVDPMNLKAIRSLARSVKGFKELVFYKRFIVTGVLDIKLDNEAKEALQAMQRIPEEKRTAEDRELISYLTGLTS